MYKDPTEFRARFKAYKEGKMPYENGLPKFAGGTPGLVNPYTLPLLQEFEGFKDTVYLDGKGIPTIGWGFTDSSLVNKGRISRKEADAELQRLAGNVESNLISKLGIDNWNQMSPESRAALISYAYNYPAGFKDTTNFMKLWRAGKYWDAIDEVDAGMYDKANPGLKKRRLKEQSYLRKDPFFLATSSAPPKKTDAELKIPIINKTDAATVNKVVPQEQTHTTWEGALDVSPYLTGKPMLRPIHRVQLPNLIDVIEDDLWEPTIGFKNGKLPKYGGGKLGWTRQNGNDIKFDEDTGELVDQVTGEKGTMLLPEVTITPKHYDAYNSTYDPNLIRNFTDFAPVVGDIGQGLDAYNAFKNKDYLLAGVLGGLLLLPNVIEKPLKAVGKVIKPALSDLVEYTYKGFDLRAPDNMVKKWKLLAAATELSGGDSSLWGNIIQKGRKYIEYPSVVNQVLKNSIYPRMKEMRPWIKDSEFDRMFNTTADNKWTMHPVETFKAAYGDKSNVVGLYTPDTGNIAVKAGGGGEDISDILLHEIRHKLDDGIPLTEEETKILKEAYGDKFLEIPKVSDDWVDTGIGEDYDMWSEAVTTNRDARSALLGPRERYMNVHQQNLAIDKMSDQQIVEAVANANGYGRRFVDNLIGDGPLDASLISKEQIEAWREAMKKIGMFSGAAYLTSKFMPEYKNGKSPIHIKPANRGKLTRLKARTGKSESELYNDGNPAHKKMVVFARNARKWKH